MSRPSPTAMPVTPAVPGANRRLPGLLSTLRAEGRRQILIAHEIAEARFDLLQRHQQFLLRQDTRIEMDL